MVQSELPISVLFMTGIGPHLPFYNQRRECLDTTSNPCGRGFFKQGAIKLIAQLVPSLGRTPELFRRCQMTQRLDYNAASPAGVKALGSVYGHIMQSGLPKALVDLVYLRVSQINGCAYCIDMHSRDLVKDGMTVDKLVLVPAWREGGALFNSTERAALAWAETVTRVAETGVPDAEYEAVATVFDRKQLADLTIAIGLINAYNRMAISFRTPPAAVKQ
jgi:AhpD family alkylhydroperoxidase